MHPGLKGGLCAAPVGGQGHHGQAGKAQRMPNHLGGIGQLWQQVRRHEGADLDFSQAAGMQGADPEAFMGQGHDGLHALQAISRAHFTDENLIHGGVGRLRAQCSHTGVGRADSR